MTKNCEFGIIRNNLKGEIRNKMKKLNFKGHKKIKALMVYGTLMAGTIFSIKKASVPEIDQSLTKIVSTNLNNTYIDELSVIESNTWTQVYTLDRSISIVDELKDLSSDDDNKITINFSDDQKEAIKNLKKEEVNELVKQYKEETNPIKKQYLYHTLASIRNYHMSNIYNNGINISKKMLQGAVKMFVCEAENLYPNNYTKVNIRPQVAGEDPNVYIKEAGYSYSDNYKVPLNSVYGSMIQSIYSIQSKEAKIKSNEKEPFTYKEVEQITKDSINLIKVSIYSKPKLEKDIFQNKKLVPENSYSMIKKQVKTK